MCRFVDLCEKITFTRVKDNIRYFTTIVVIEVTVVRVVTTVTVVTVVTVLRVVKVATVGKIVGKNSLCPKDIFKRKVAIKKF